MNTMELWHGGRDLEYSHREFIGSKKGRWEHGPGLYLTTHYETARDYAKGGGKTYRVEVSEGTYINHVNLPIGDVNEFVSRNIIKSKQKSLLDDIYENMHRMNQSVEMNAEHFLNLVFNLDAITNTKTDKLNRFLVEHGVDYGLVTRFKGRDETVLVVFNHQKVNRVKAISAKDVSLDDYELPFTFNTTKILKP